MKIKTKDLTGAALDWAVARAKGERPSLFIFQKTGTLAARHHYSTNWAQGGPIIERERISIRQWTNVPIVHAYMPQDDAPWASDGTSLLIAAMRCYVASKLGDEVEVPEELVWHAGPN